MSRGSAAVEARLGMPRPQGFCEFSLTARVLKLTVVLPLCLSSREMDRAWSYQ
jgi:hypothetical protein